MRFIRVDGQFPCSTSGNVLSSFTGSPRIVASMPAALLDRYYSSPFTQNISKSSRKGCQGDIFAYSHVLSALPREANVNDRCGAKRCTYDLVTLSNLCVDVLVPLDSLPDDVKVDSGDRKKLLQYLTANPPGKDAWEVGGNTNTLIAASRLGMRVAAVGHVGEDTFGKFLEHVLVEERTGIASTILDESLPSIRGEETLVCFVLVDKETNEHTFCSRYDFGPWPLFQQVKSVSEEAALVLSNTAAVFVNGFVFDEIPEELVVQAAKIAQSHGAAVLFDPGPRSWTFETGVRRHALESMLDIADIILMTEEEAGAVVGTEDAQEAIKLLMARPNTRATWFIIKQGKEGALLGDTSTGLLYHQEGYHVAVEDTVGCGDSFAAAIALGFTRNRDIPSTLALAGAVGAATAMGVGAGRNVADVERIKSILSRHQSTMGTDTTIQGALAMIGTDDQSVYETIL